MEEKMIYWWQRHVNLVFCGVAYTSLYLVSFRIWSISYMLLTLPCDACGVLATLTFLSLSRDLVIASGRKFLSVTCHLPTGRCQNFIHLVTGHTPGRIDRNGTVSCSGPTGKHTA